MSNFTQYFLMNSSIYNPAFTRYNYKPHTTYTENYIMYVFEDGYKMIFTNMNYIFMVVLALAINDIIKFYINRSIKFSNGTHYYFIYYGVAMFFIVVFSSKLLHE